jgi:predicted acyl esterase
MPDGVRLFACLSMPRGQEAGAKVPALLTMDPYALYATTILALLCAGTLQQVM